MTDDKRIQVQRTIEASSDRVFDVLSNPHRHPELDGSGVVVGLERGDRITQSGQQFRMNMTGDHMGGEYQTDNHVTGYQPHQLLAWKTAPAGEEPPGWEWVYELTPAGPEQTDVTLTYDWSSVTDKQLLKKIRFPLVGKDELETSLAQLAAAVSG